jgi:hypothetical protein
MEVLVFLQLLAVSFVVSVLASTAVVLLFDHPIRLMCRHLVGDTLSAAWHRFLRFGLLVTGLSSGVSMWTLEKYVTPRSNEAEVVVLNADRWTLEVYRSAIGTLQATACALFTFFLFALIAHVILKLAQLKAAVEPA